MALTPEQVYKPFSTEIKLITYYFDSYLRDHAQILSLVADADQEGDSGIYWDNYWEVHK